MLSQLDVITAMGDHNFPDPVKLAVEELCKQQAVADSGSPRPSSPVNGASDWLGPQWTSSEDSSSSSDDSGEEEKSGSDSHCPSKRRREGSLSPTTSASPPPPVEFSDSESPTNAGPTKSKSATESQRLRKAMKDGTHVAKEESLAAWKVKLKAADRRVAFDRTRMWSGRCSNCRKWIAAKEAGDSTRFRQHRTDCLRKLARGKAPALKDVPPITHFFAPASTTQSTHQPTPQPIPQPTPRPSRQRANQKTHPRAMPWAHRTGGLPHPPLPDSCLRLWRWVACTACHFAGKLKKLKHINAVIETQLHEQKWLNDHRGLRVVSTMCEKEVVESASGERYPCISCANVYASHAFKVAINKKRTNNPKKLKFTPHRHRQGLVGRLFARYEGLEEVLRAENASSPCIRVAKAYLDGKLKGKEVLGGLQLSE
jgi:hypothetical protein